MGARKRAHGRAASVAFETRLLVRGELVAGAGAPLDIENPYDESTLTTLGDGVRRAGGRSCLAAIHERFRTPHVATVAVSALAVAWYVPANLISENFLFDTLSALALMIAFYYALSGVACVVYYRREVLRSARNFLLIGVGPALGAAALAYLFIEATRTLADIESSYTAQRIAGLSASVAMGYGFLLLGAVLLVAWRFGGGRRFFGRRPFEAVDPDVAAGRARTEATAGLE